MAGQRRASLGKETCALATTLTEYVLLGVILNIAVLRVHDKHLGKSYH